MWAYLGFSHCASHFVIFLSLDEKVSEPRYPIRGLQEAWENTERSPAKDRFDISPSQTRPLDKAKNGRPVPVAQRSPSKA